MRALGQTSGPDQSFPGILSRHAEERPDKLAFVFLDSQGREAERLTFRNLHERACAIAAALDGLGVAGRNVLLVFPPGLDFVAALFGCFRAGAVAVPIPFTAGRRTEDRIAGICRDAVPVAVLSVTQFTAADRLRVHLEAVGQPPWLFTDTIGLATSPAAPITSDTLAFLQYTSGSTSAPKGVMLSHGNLVANNEMVARSFGHDESAVGVSWLPLFHDMGLVGHVLQPVFVGGTSVLMSPFTFLQRPVTWLQAISDWRATTSGGPSHGFALALRAIRDDALPQIDLSSWTVAYCGAEKVRGDVLEDFATRLTRNGFDPAALHPCYGLAEATLLVTSVGRQSGLRLRAPAGGIGAGEGTPASIGCGQAWCGSTVDIIDADRGTPVAEGIVGEVRVRGPHVGHGYWGRAEESAAVFEAGEAGRTLRTGDLGFMLGDELFVVGRLKDTIIAFGVKHAAEDIEGTIARSDPLFAKLPAAAFAIDRDGREQVVVVQEASTDTGPDELAEAVRRGQTAVTAEHGLRLTELRLVRKGTLPRTTSGKVQRGRARTLYAEGGLLPLRSAPAATPG